MEGDSDFRPWNELIPDTLGLIFNNLEPQEVLQVIPLVCKSWCKVVQGPYCWQRIDIGDFIPNTILLEKVVEQLLQALIPRSSGCLRELCVSRIDDHMLSFITEHAGALQMFEIINSTISESGFELFLKTSTSLTTLVIKDCIRLSMPSLEAIRRNCKGLVSLTWRDPSLLMSKKPCHDVVDYIMPNLKRLSLHFVLMNDEFVLELLSCCPELEWVVIRGGYGLMLDPRVVKEKCPNIVTMNIGEENVSESDYSDHWGDCSSYGSVVDYYGEYYESDDDL